MNFIFQKRTILAITLFCIFPTFAEQATQNHKLSSTLQNLQIAGCLAVVIKTGNECSLELEGAPEKLDQLDVNYTSQKLQISPKKQEATVVHGNGSVLVLGDGSVVAYGKGSVAVACNNSRITTITRSGLFGSKAIAVVSSDSFHRCQKEDLVKVIITIPSFAKLVVENMAKADIEKCTLKNLDLELADSSSVTLQDLAVEKLNIQQADASVLDGTVTAKDQIKITSCDSSKTTLQGSTDALIVDSADVINLKAAQLTANHVTINACDGSKIQVNPISSLKVDACDGASISYIKEPSRIREHLSDGATSRKAGWLR